MNQTRPFAEIGILLYPGCLLSAVYGLSDLFMVANKIAQSHEGIQRPIIRTTHWAWEDGAQGIVCTSDTHPEFAHQPLVLIAPPHPGDPIEAQTAVPYAAWLKVHHDKGATLASVCAGSFLLGATGLLDGRTSTTHWMYTNAMKERFPGTRVEGDKLMIDDGDIITAGGFMAWTDLGLRLVHRVLGPTIMMETARFMLVDPPGREQRYYSSFTPQLLHGDEAILKVQHWLQATGAKQVTLAGMTQKAGLEERTFIRRFHKATGLKPTEYCQHVRVGKAREMLEFTHQTMEQISWAIGYEDPGAFRKVFYKVIGLTPGEYRQRFMAAA